MAWFRIHLSRFCSSFVQANPRTEVQAEEEHAKREGRQADEAKGRVGGGRVGRWAGVCLELGEWDAGMWWFGDWVCGVSYVSSLYIYPAKVPGGLRYFLASYVVGVGLRRSV